MRRIALVFLLAAGALALLVVALGAVARKIVSPAAVEAQLEAQLGRDVDVRAVELRFAPTPQIHVEGLRLGPGLELDELDVDLDDRALLAGQLEFDDLAFRGVRLELVRRADGGFGLAGSASGGPLGLPPVASLEVRDARVRVRDEALPGEPPLELHLDHLAVSDLAPGRTARIEAVARVGSGGGRLLLDAALGPLEARPAFAEAPGTLDLVARDVDAGVIAARLPASWRVALPGGGRLDAAVALRRTAAGDLAAKLDVSVRTPELDAGPLRIIGPARLVGELERNGGQLALRDTRLEAARAELDGLTVHEVRATVDGAFSELAVDVRMAGLGLRDAQLEDATLAGRLRAGPPLEIRDGELRAGTARFRQHAGRDLHAGFQLLPHELEIAELRLEAFGGRVRQRGRVALGAPPELDFEIELEDVDLRALAGGVGEGEPVRTQARARISGAWTGEENWLAPLAGSGELRSSGGTLAGATITRAISDALRAAVPGAGNGEPRADTRRAAVLEKATASLAIEEGRIRSENLRVETSDYRLKGRGSLGHDGSLDVRSEVTLSSAGVDGVLAWLPVGPSARKSLRMPAIPVRITGSAGQPTARADVASMPLATLAGLLNVPSRAKNLIKGAAEGAGAALRGGAGPAEPGALSADAPGDPSADPAAPAPP